MADYSAQERTYYDSLFKVVDTDTLGILTGEAAYPFLLKSNLSQPQLGTIWSLADDANNGYLTTQGWYKACRLIGHAQAGTSISNELAAKRGPFPVFEGHTPPSNPLTVQTTGSAAPALNPQDKAQFTRLFVGAGPENGLLSATKAQGIFVKSGLPTETLAQTWNLADTQQRGALDLTDFVIGMYYLQSLMAGGIKTVPTTLPAGLYEQASGGRTKPTAPLSPISRQMTGSPARLTQQLTGQNVMQPQRTGPSILPTRQFSTPTSGLQSSFAPPAPVPTAQVAWDVTPDAKSASDRFFDGLDTNRKGYIEGDIAVPFLMQSGLPETDLAQVWDLADIRKEGKLSKDEFAVAMFLINNKLSGHELPTALSQSTIPPSLRSQSGPAKNDITKDLFDVFGDSPPATGPTQQQQSYFNPAAAPNQARAPLPAPSRAQTVDAFGSSPFGTQEDLMGDEVLSPPAQVRSPPPPPQSQPQPRSQPPVDRSSEINTAQNTLNSTQRSIDDLSSQKSNLESESNGHVAQLREIEMRLSSVKAQHETETRVVDDLKSRVGEQNEQLVKLRQDLIQNESELSALRAEKDETEQALLRDKEEVRNISKRMQVVGEETNTLKALLEKLRKEARQQKGMIAISKKQVATAESTRDVIQTEVDQAAQEKHALDEEEVLQQTPPSRSQDSPFIKPATQTLTQAAAIPLPVTPQQALSPNATGTGQRSTNPFERLGFSAKPLERSVSGASQASTPQVAQTPREEQEGVSLLQSIGGLAVAGAVAAGAMATTAMHNTTAAVADAAEQLHLTSSRTDEDDKIATPVVQDRELPVEAEEIATPAARPQVQADPFGIENEGEKTPSAVVSSDPFGLPEREGAQVQARSDDPFGFSNDGQGEAAGAFDDGFGDDFSKGFAQPSAPPQASVPMQETATATLPDDLAPASQTAQDFEEAFEEPPRSVASAVPAALRPQTLEREFSTQVLAPTSTVGTPVTEFPPSTPRSFESEPVPVQADRVGGKSLHEHDDSSSDEGEDGPEDLDRARSPYSSGQREPTSPRDSPLSDVHSVHEQRETPIVQSVPPAVSSPPAQLTSLGLGAPLAISGLPEMNSNQRAMEAQNEFDPFAQQSASPVNVRRQPPPPPPASQRSASTSGGNPFAISQPAFSVPSGPTAPVMANVAGKPSTSSLDDDDFDFDDLPPARIAQSEPVSAPGAGFGQDVSKSQFDDEFDDFSPDFEVINKPSQEDVYAGHFQSNSNPFPSTQRTVDASRQENAFEPSPNSGFSFDDAFTGTAASFPPPATQTRAPAPVPTSRPDLPQRQTTTKAQPDDLEDVKKLCGMGFDRDLVIAALEGEDYNFNKALNFLLPSA